MNVKKKVRVLLLVVLLLSILLAGYFVWRGKTVRAFALEDIQLKEEYVVGEVLEFPDASFVYEEETYRAETVLHYPGGRAEKRNSVSFSMPGLYTLEYKKVINGKLFSESRQLKVVDYLYSVNNAHSSAVYKIDDSQYETGISGIEVSLVEGSTFTFHKSVNLAQLDKGEDAISLFVLPWESGVRDITDIVITFTDVYDSSNQVIVQANAVHKGTSPWQRKAGMMFAGTSTSALYGRRTDSVNGIYYANVDDKMGGYLAPRYGYETNFSFGGNGANPVGQEFITVSFDLENKQLYGPDNGWATEHNSSLLLADLSDDTVFPKAWKGFTTGEVYVSIRCDGYANSSARFMINKIGKEDLTATYYGSVCASTLEVDCEGYDKDELPVGAVNRAYNLFKATSRDYYNGVQQVSPRVFFAYDSSNPTEVEVKNGAFVPDRVGTYTVVYSLTDGFGVATTETLKVEVKENAPELFVQFDNVEDVEGYTGIASPLKDVLVSGGSGRYDVSVAVKKDGTSVSLTEESFVPQTAGRYEIAYTVSDYLKTEKTLSYAFVAENNPNPVAKQSPKLPDYFLEGKTYQLEDCLFYDYSTDTPTLLPCEIKIVDGNGEHLLTAASKYTVCADANEEVKVQYAAESITGRTELNEVTIPVIRTGAENEALDVSKYFIPTNGATVTLTEEGVEIATLQNGGFTFAKSLLADTFKFYVQIDKERNNFDALDIYLTDYVNAAQTIKLSLAKSTETGKIAVYVNDIQKNSQVSATFQNGVVAIIKYENGRISVNGTELLFTLKEDLAGNVFNGFDSGRITLRGAFNGVMGESAINVTMVNNQPFSTAITEDAMRPEIYTVGKYQTVNEIGVEAKVLNVYCDDVLDTYTEVFVSVVDSKGRAVVDKNGTTLKNVVLKEYVFILNEYGSYKVTYTVKDALGETYTCGTYTLGVYDFEPPVLTIEGEISSVASLGDTIILPKALVTDNKTVETSYELYVMEPYGKYTAYYCEKTGVDIRELTFTQTGVWTITYMAIDEEGNITVKNYTVKVS